MDKKLEDLLKIFDSAIHAQPSFEHVFHGFVNDIRKIISDANERLAHFDNVTPPYAPREEVIRMLEDINEIKREISATLMLDSTYASIVRRIEKELAIHHLGSGVPYTRSKIEDILKKEGLEIRHDLLTFSAHFRLDIPRGVESVELGGTTYYGVVAERGLTFVKNKSNSLRVEHRNSSEQSLPYSFTAADIDIINQESVRKMLTSDLDLLDLHLFGLLKAHDKKQLETRYYFLEDFPNTYHGNFVDGEYNGLGREQVHRARNRLVDAGVLREGEHFIIAEDNKKRPYYAYSDTAMSLIKNRIEFLKQHPRSKYIYIPNPNGLQLIGMHLPKK